MSDIFNRKRDRNVRIGLFAAIFAVIGVTTLVLSNASSTRDPFEYPFNANSVWNTPIGSNARYVDSGLPYTNANAIDYAYFTKMRSSDPSVDYIRTGGWRDRCSGTQDTGVNFNLPRNFEIEPPSQNENGSWRTPNNGFEFLRPDGRTVYGGGGGARCQAGGPVYGAGGISFDVYGDGLRGSHGASKLPRLGGAIRPGELSNDEPIQHVLDIVLYTKWAYSDNKQTRESTYRWPASGSDAYALDRNKTDRYIGNNPQMKMGALLAIPPSVTMNDLNITTKEGRKLFAALRDWGAYFTDDSAWNANYLTVDAAAEGTFQWNTQQRQELGRMVDALHVVANNGPNSIGGGGTPRVPKHPYFRNGNNNTPPPPTTTPDEPTTPDPEQPQEEEINPAQDAYILPAENLLSSVTASAASQVSDTFTPDKAVDGDELTNESRWTSAREDNQWLQLDLGSRQSIEKLSILWAGDTTRTYDVRVSDDGSSYNTVASGETDNQKYTLTEHDLSGATARYVRIYGLSRWNTNFGNSIREVGVYVGEEPGDIVVPTPTDPDPEPEPPTEVSKITVPYRVNSGGEGYTDGAGNRWNGDAYFITGGGDYAVSNTIAATDNQRIYQSERWCTPGYVFPIDNGEYTVVLHAAEINPPNDGRVFSMAVEGSDVVTSLDLSREVGNFTAFSQSTDVVVRDGALNVDLTNVDGCAKISAIEVLPKQDIDEQSPEVQIVNIAEDQEVSGEVTVNVNANDNKEVSEVTLSYDGQVIGTSAQSNASFTWDTNGVDNGSVTLLATAVDSSGNESFDRVTVMVSNVVVDTTAPTTPQNLQASSVEFNRVTLTWEESSDASGVKQYNIRRNGRYYVSTTSTSYTDNNVDDSTEYTYEVVAEDDAGNLSDRSTAIAVTTDQAPDTDRPSVPASFTATVDDEGNVVMSWNASSDNVGVDGYFVHRNDRIIASLEETTFTDRTAVAGVTYRYSVRAYDAARNYSARSNVESVTIQSEQDTTPPSVPKNLRHVRYLPWKSQVVFAWNASTDDSGERVRYNVYRNGKRIATTSSRSFSDATIRKNVRYNYKISALDSSGNESARGNNLFFRARR